MDVVIMAKRAGLQRVSKTIDVFVNQFESSSLRVVKQSRRDSLPT